MHLSRSLNVWLGDVCVDEINDDNLLSPESLSKDFNPLAPLLGPLLHCELSYCGIASLISRYTNLLGKIVSLQLSSLGVDLRIVGNGLPTAEVGITHLIPHKIYLSKVADGIVSCEEELTAKISDSPSATNGLP